MSAGDKSPKGRRKYTGSQKLATLAIMTAISMALSVLESYVPMPVPVPGIKLGLANIVTLVLLGNFGLVSILTVSVARCVLAAVFSGAITAMVFSLAGGVCSCALMCFFYGKADMRFSMIGISVIGAEAHNTAQIVTAMLLMKDGAIIYYLPALLLCGIVSGVVIGFCALRVTKVLSFG